MASQEAVRVLAEEVEAGRATLAAKNVCVLTQYMFDSADSASWSRGLRSGQALGMVLVVLCSEPSC